MKYLIFIILLLSADSLPGQSIYSALHLNRPEDVKENNAIKEIEEQHVSFTSSGREINKNKKTFNSNYFVQTEERFDEEGTLTARLTMKFDSLEQKIISRKLERWHKVVGYSSETAIYEYDSQGYLIRMTDKDANGQILRHAILSNNNKGHPVRLEGYDAKGNLIGYEVATYNYPTNEAIVEVKHWSGKTLSTNSITVDFTKSKEFPQEGDVFNEHGDLVRSKEFIYERKYDEFGNWTIETIYELVNGKRKKDRVFKRRIKYEE